MVKYICVDEKFIKLFLVTKKIGHHPQKNLSKLVTKLYKWTSSVTSVNYVNVNLSQYKVFSKSIEASFFQNGW